MTIKLTSNDTQEHIVEDWRQLTNLPDSMVGVARNIRAGATYTVEISSPEEGARLYVQDSSYNRTKLRSRIGKKVDYYFMWDGTPASNIDGAVKLFRHVTGEAPMFADWAYGFWQCKEHYHTQEELLDAAATFRKKKIPVDAIVQDWHCEFLGVSTAAQIMPLRSTVFATIPLTLPRVPFRLSTRAHADWGDLGWGPQWDPKIYLTLRAWSRT